MASEQNRSASSWSGTRSRPYGAVSARTKPGGGGRPRASRCPTTRPGGGADAPSVAVSCEPKASRSRRRTRIGDHNPGNPAPEPRPGPTHAPAEAARHFRAPTPKPRPRGAPTPFQGGNSRRRPRPDPPSVYAQPSNRQVWTQSIVPSAVVPRFECLKQFVSRRNGADALAFVGDGFGETDVLEIVPKTCPGAGHLFPTPRSVSTLDLGQQLPELPARLEAGMPQNPTTGPHPCASRGHPLAHVSLLRPEADS
jgi:hypothetical protein